MERRMRGTRGSVLRTLAAAAAWLAAGAMSAADLDATVTSVQGEARVAREKMAQGARVGGDAPIVTAPDARGSVLLGADAVVQFCGDTSLRLREEATSTVVAVSQGTAKTTSGRRPSDRPLEIHTPAAVAVIHGTEVSTTIDPATGATTFAVDEGVVEIRPGGGAPVTLRAGESVTVPPGGPAGPVERIRPDRLADQLDCLEDSLFHVASLERTREGREARLVDVLVAQERPDLPPGDTAPPIEETLPEPASPDLPDPCPDPTVCQEPDDLAVFFEPPPMPTEPQIDLCDSPGPPGEHCQF